MDHKDTISKLINIQLDLHLELCIFIHIVCLVPNNFSPYYLIFKATIAYLKLS